VKLSTMRLGIIHIIRAGIVAVTGATESIEISYARRTMRGNGWTYCIAIITLTEAKNGIEIGS